MQQSADITYQFLVANINDYDERKRKEFRGRQTLDPVVSCQVVSLPKEALLVEGVAVQLRISINSEVSRMQVRSQFLQDLYISRQYV